MVAVDKLAWRRVLLARRDAVPVGERRLLSRRIAERLLAEPALSSAAQVAIYRAVGSEVDSSDLHAGLGARGARVLYPRVLRAERSLEFAPCDDPELLTRGSFGIPEPTGQAAALAEIEVVVLPGVGFDRRGVRLGTGAGYYDRALRDFHGVSVGIAFACQLVDELPETAADRRVDMLVTDKEVLALGRSERGGAAWPS